MRLRYLKWWDILILTVILFGPAIISSTQMLLSSNANKLVQEAVFSTADNIRAIVSQSIQLLLAGGYLFVRRFDFSQWEFKITFKSTLFAIGLFFFFGACMDIVSCFTNGIGWIPEYLKENVPIISALSLVNLPLVLFSLLNGFYEEIFFIGICTCVETKYRWIAFIYSLIIRISFHTYQGIVSALGIGLILGIVYFLLYIGKTKNLFPYILSHAFSDIFGLGLLHFL